MALRIEITDTPAKYLQSLDKPTRRRIAEKLKALADDPTDIRLSLPLSASNKRRARVGSYRILFTFDNETLTVADIGPRGQIYRKA
ncbi:MAG: type II toxin-antitoxin system RelE family toxin [Candidatus Acidiferrum sp.]